MRPIIAVIIFSFASAICSAASASANISPFVPAEPSKMEADIARVEFLKTKFARMSQQQQQPQPEVKLQEVETTTNNSNIPGRCLISSDYVYDLV